MSNDRVCPIEGCKGRVNPGKLMCYAHWCQVPKPQQTRVYRAWGAYMNSNLGPPVSKKLWSEYLQARDAAIASISTPSSKEPSSDHA